MILDHKDAAENTIFRWHVNGRILVRVTIGSSMGPREYIVGLMILAGVLALSYWEWWCDRDDAKLDERGFDVLTGPATSDSSWHDRGKRQ